MEDCTRDDNDRRSTDRRMDVLVVAEDRRKGSRRSGSDRRALLSGQVS
tara:strand:- start:562 stop:705 length:144 start_codon:yes stop_codon:yes gene_type:complete